MTTGAATPVRLGLTGGIGSGKSTVGQMLAERGATLLDADAMARSVTGPGGAAMEAIAAAFGPAYVDATGALDRGRMRALAFSEPSARQRLEAIVHPWVARLTEAHASAAAAAGQRLLVFDIPLLVESGRWRRQLDAVVVVDCRVQTQIDRVVARSALASDAVEAIIAAQASRSARRAAADAVVYNDGLSLAALRGQVHALAARFGL